MNDEGRVLALVSCVSRKRATPSPARDLYTSDWFKKARAYVEARHHSWLILSAKHGLLEPGEVVGPYEQTLNTMGIAARRAWSERVLAALVPRLSNVDRVVILAGDRYRTFLVPHIKALGIEVDVPLLGLGIGQQLKWFKDREAEP